MTTDVDAFRAALAEAVAPWALNLSDLQFEQLRGHYAAMVEANAVMNLTRIVQPVEAAIKHYADSLALVRWARTSEAPMRSLLDIGTGAGFPAFPVAVAAASCQVVALDGTGKKIDFLAKAASAAGVTNLTAVHEHSSHWESDRRFEVVTARAVGPIEDCMSAATKFLARSGTLVLFRTAEKVDVEIEAAQSAATKAKLAPSEPFTYELHLGPETLRRVLVVYRVATRR